MHHCWNCVCNLHFPLPYKYNNPHHECYNCKINVVCHIIKLSFNNYSYKASILIKIKSSVTTTGTVTSAEPPLATTSTSVKNKIHYYYLNNVEYQVFDSSTVV